MKINNNRPAEFPTTGELRLTRLLPGPIESVWAHLTDPEKRACWFGGGVVEPKTGGKAEFVMHHAKIAPGETPPEQYKKVHDEGVTFDGRVLRYEPPRVLAFTFGSEDSDVTFELTPEGNQVLLVLTHRTRGEDRAELSNYAAGWHSHFNLLIALLKEKKTRPPFWATHAWLKTEYERQLAARDK